MGREATSTSTTSRQGPMVGVRVIDLGTVFAAPYAANLLADFGADVLKVELPGVGDPNRAIGPIVKGVPGPWTTISRNKRCISLDIRMEKGKEIFKRLVATADVVIENFRPGTLERWGLGFDALKAVNRRILLVRVSGYGQTGPFRHKAGFGTPATAFSGLTYMQGNPDRAPVSPPIAVADYVTGTYAAMAAAMALHYLRVHEDAEGQQVDIALYESMFRMLETPIAEYDLLGKVRERAGNNVREAAPSGTFQAADGKWLTMGTTTDNTFHRLADAMGRPDLKTDPRFDTADHRLQNREEIVTVVEDWFRRYSGAEAIEILDSHDVPNCPINSMADIFQHPHFQARENLVRVAHPILGTVAMPGVVPKFSATPGAVLFPGPVSVGEHNQEVYQDELGISAEELEALKAEGVI